MGDHLDHLAQGVPELRDVRHVRLKVNVLHPDRRERLCDLDVRLKASLHRLLLLSVLQMKIQQLLAAALHSRLGRCDHVRVHDYDFDSDHDFVALLLRNLLMLILGQTRQILPVNRLLPLRRSHH